MLLCTEQGLNSKTASGLEGLRGLGGREEQVPLVTSVWYGSVAGDALALPLVECIQLVGVIANSPLLGIQVLPLIKLVPGVIPVSIQGLWDTNKGRWLRREG